MKNEGREMIVFPYLVWVECFMWAYQRSLSQIRRKSKGGNWKKMFIIWNLLYGSLQSFSILF